MIPTDSIPIDPIDGDAVNDLSAASNVLISPFNYDDLDAWRHAVTEAAKALFDADLAVFNLPLGGSADFYSENIDPTALEAYPKALTPLDETHDVWERAAAMEVATRKMIWDDHLDDYYESDYYNELVRPQRAFHGLVISMPIDDGPASADTVAQLVLHHDSPDAPSFDEHDLLLGHLLLPAFQSGIKSRSLFSRHQSDFAKVIDSVNQGLLLFDRTGEEIHRNPALTEILDTDPERDQIEARLHQVAQALVHLGGDGAPTSERSQGVEDTVKTRMDQYRVNGSYLGRALLNRDRVILVTLERSGRSLPSPRALMDRFDLTPQESRVARLLAERKTNEEIAETLVISPHTARGHTEKVLSKLGVESRFEVRSVLLGTLNNSNGAPFA